MNISFHQLRRLGLLAALVVSVVATSGGNAIAADIPAGFDNYIALPSSSVTFTAGQIPADFFGPGSDPFVGTVCYEGDTTIERLNDANFTGGPPETTIPIELVSLNLVSCEPVVVTYNGGNNSELRDFSIQMPGSPQGTLTATKTHPNGGTFYSTFFVEPLFTFTQLDYPYHIAQWTALGAFDLSSADPNDPWSNQNPVGIPPNTSDFYPGGTPGNQAIPAQIITLSGGGMQLDLVLVPEPATLSLLAVGALALLRRKRSH